MVETEGQDFEIPETGAVGVSSELAHGPGSLLREAREKNGLTHRVIAERTRLRPHILKALEDEAWDALPPPAFVRGFLRTYGRALSLDEAHLVELYNRLAPPEEDPLRGLERATKKGGGKRLLLLCLLAAVAALFYAWKDWAPTREAGDSDSGPQTVMSGVQEKVVIQMTKPIAVSRKEPEPEKAAGILPAQTSPASQRKPSYHVGVGAMIMESGDTWPERAASESTPARKPETSPDSVREPMPAATPREHVLKGEVTAKTWVRVRIDDLEPREYMFQPGARQEWKARERFDVLLGNAGGIQFELDGKALPKLGGSGQVRRWRFPEDLPRAEQED